MMSEVKLNKSNVCGVINDYLNKKGVRFKLGTYSNDFLYELDIQDSISTYIQIESYKELSNYNNLKINSKFVIKIK